MTSKLTHCRLCGENSKMEHLFDLSADQKIKEDCYKKLEHLKIDFIDFESTVLPKTCCVSCFKSLQDSYDFVLKIKEAQIYLNNFYKNADPSLYVNSVKKESFEEIDANIPTVISSPTKIDVEIGGLGLETHYLNFKDINAREKRSLHSPNIYQQFKKHIHINSGESNTKNRINLTKTHKKHHKTEDPTNYDTVFEDIDLSDQNFLEPKNIFKLATQEHETSWVNYDWFCQHCGAKFDTMSKVRDHSKVVHAVCHGYKCVDCTEIFNYFNPFIEHVRQHRKSLRLYCQYCNIKSATSDECLNHSITHWNSSHICELCGELLPNSEALQRHKRVYKKVVLPQKFYKKKPRKIECCITWKEYEWVCQDCNLKLPDVESLRSHTRCVHRKCFSMKCVDCLVVMGNYKQFVDHVTSHRPCLQNYCQYCNAYYPDEAKLKEHIASHFIDTKPCEGCGEIFANSSSLVHHMTIYDAPRVRGTNNSESLTCGVCSKYFPNAFQLRNHKVIHNEKRERDQICHSCGKAFYDLKTLTNHIKTHFNKTEVCEICQKTFLTKQRLKVHISTHLEVKQFVCNECDKKFRRKSQLRLHLASHSDVLPFRCLSCNKSFRLSSYLKIHERLHTGIRPYSCEICNETFNHWGNCNRHMIRKHGVTYAKTKITAQGKLDINRQTGEAKSIEIGNTAKDWCNEMLKPKKRGRRKKE